MRASKTIKTLISIQRRRHGKTHWRPTYSFFSLGINYSQVEKLHPKAIKVFRRFLKMTEGDDSMRTVDLRHQCLTHMAYVYKKLGKHELAAKSQRKAIDVLENAEHPKIGVGASYITLAVYLAHGKKLKEADLAYRQGLAKLQIKPGGSSSMAFRAHSGGYANFRNKTGSWQWLKTGKEEELTDEARAKLAKALASGLMTMMTGGGRKETPPIVTAAMVGDEGEVKRFLEEGASVDERAKDGTTPLLAACLGGHLQIIKLLVERGASLTAKTKTGTGILHHVLEGFQIDKSRRARQKMAGAHGSPFGDNHPFGGPSGPGGPGGRFKNPFGAMFIMLGQPPADRKAIVEYLLTKGANINEQDNLENTLLHKVGLDEEGKVTKLLLEKNKDPNAQNRLQRTPLHYAAMFKNDQLALLLIEKGALKDAKDVLGMTPLHLGAANKASIVCDLILSNTQAPQKVAAVNLKTVKDIRGRTASVTAERHMNRELADKLKP